MKNISFPPPPPPPFFKKIYIDKIIEAATKSNVRYKNWLLLETWPKSLLLSKLELFDFETQLQWMRPHPCFVPVLRVWYPSPLKGQPFLEKCVCLFVGIKSLPDTWVAELFRCHPRDPGLIKRGEIVHILFIRLYSII